MRLTRKADLALASLIIGVLVPFPARAQTLATLGGPVVPGVSRVPSALYDHREFPWQYRSDSDGLIWPQPSGYSPGSALGANPSFKRDASAFTALGLSPLLILEFTHAAFPWSAPAWNDDLKLWINGLSVGSLGRPEEGVTAFSDGPIYPLLASPWVGPQATGPHLGRR